MLLVRISVYIHVFPLSLMRILFILAFTLILASCNGPTTVIDEPSTDNTASSQIATSSDESLPSSQPASAESTPSATSIPASVRITMPFASQAPLGNWDPPYDEACEEASLIIVHHYLEKTPLNKDIMNEDILAMVAHEESMGLPIDIDMNELSSVAKSMYGYNTEVVEGSNVTIERIETELAQGNPVIVPLAGQDIGNPNYTGEGPPYHVLVIVGYDKNNFVTHDVGTRKGENYVYRKEVIMDAIHDWNGSVDTIRSGPRRMLVVTK